MIRMIFYKIKTLEINGLKDKWKQKSIIKFTYGMELLKNLIMIKKIYLDSMNSIFLIFYTYL